MDRTPRIAGILNSLLGRLFWRVGLTMLGAVLLVVGILAAEFLDHVDTLRDRSLNGQVLDIARHLSVSATGQVTVALPAGLAAAYQGGRASYRYAVLSPDGKLLAGSGGVSGPLADDLLNPGPQVQYFSTVNPKTARKFFGATLSRKTAAGPVTVQVQQGGEHEDVLVDTLMDKFADEVLWILVLIFIAILMVTYWTLRGALASLTQASERAAAIGPETLDRRLPVDSVPTEVKPMIAAINEALDRVEGAYRQQQRFIADAAHEMRTPITVLRAHLQSLDKASGEGSLGQDLIALERVVSQLLKLAQVDALSQERRGPLDLHEVAVNTAALMGPGAIAAGRTLAVTGDPRASVYGDGGAIEVALRNLVENALELSPPGSEVEIQVDAGSRTLRVLDRGPGVAPELRERIFERFWRGEHRQGPGAGLGLSIVRRITMAHAITVSVADREGGGAVFALHFPQQ